MAHPEGTKSPCSKLLFPLLWPSASTLLVIVTASMAHQHVAQAATGIPRVSNSSVTNSGEFLSSTAWHARELTNISWGIATGDINRLHLIVVSWDEAATETWRFDDDGSADNDTTRAESPPSGTTSSTSHSTSDYVPQTSQDEALPESCAIRYEVYTAHLNDTFYQEETRQQALPPVLVNSSTWWYTASLDQEKPTATSNTSVAGTASMLLSEPGLYFACLLVGDETCYEEECVNITVYQPPEDFLEIESTHVGAITTVRFNLVDHNAYSGDWAWILGGVDPTFTVDDANDLSSVEVSAQFDERCWFYFGRALELGEAFLCSPDPDTTLASLQSTSTVRAYQYGSLRFYSSFAGNGSLWLSRHEFYTYAMVQSFYTCGITVQALESRTVNTTTDLTVTAIPEAGNTCAVGSGIELRIRTGDILTPAVTDVETWTYFVGRLVNLTSERTELSIRLPYQGYHSIKILLDSGAVLDTLHVTAFPSDPYAPSCQVTERPPGSLPIGSSISMSLTSRDYYSNEISESWGADAFQSWTFNSILNMTLATVIDNGGGSYSVLSSVQNVTGTTFLFVERNGLGVPGSPFEVYFFGPTTCQVVSSVGECGSSLTRKVEQQWAANSACDGIFDAPTSYDVPCGYVAVNSSLGKLVISCSMFAALYASLYLVWIRRHRQFVVVKLSQPFVCQLFLTGCILLNLTAILFVGKPADVTCVMRPWLLHVSLTFSSSCLYLKTYRVHRIFNSPKISRISITDRQLVTWVLQLVAVDMLVLGAWMVAHRPQRIYQTETYNSVEVLNPVCAGGSALFSIVLWSWKACLNLFGVVMAAKTWNCEDGVGESQPICLSVYNTMLLGLVNIAVRFLVNKISVVVGASTLTAVAGSIFTISVLFGPKVYRLSFHGDLSGNAGHRRHSNSTMTHTGSLKTGTSLGRRRSSMTGTLSAGALGIDFSKIGKKIRPIEPSTLETSSLSSPVPRRGSSNLETYHERREREGEGS